ncbi:uncharacterized protein LOC114516577 [Dendronephthya gigantea]|uniref:uncharacterized protein LOC114516577 n=1 Tax=Dendronephthya gigantea TaxID=151771 RepID=UPI00106B148C|nr:uncharacterized protein LOC114516577 [Dendronephthya gigantea]
MSCHLNSGSQNLTRSPLVHKPGCRYYEFPTPKNTCLESQSRQPICCLPSSDLCFNGGSCSEDETRRFKCQCADGYYGRQCNIENPTTCLDYWTDQVKPLSGEYSVVGPDGKSYKIFCDFDSEDKMAWTLFQSFDVAHEAPLMYKSLSADLPLNEHDLNWKLFRLPKSVMSSMRLFSTFWRGTCSYATYGVDYRDYLRVRLSMMNPLDYKKYYSDIKTNPCITVDYLDIKGNNCEGCSQSFLQHDTNALHMKPKQSREQTSCTFNSLGIEYRCPNGGGRYAHILGLYSKTCLDPNYRCTLNENSTTEFWFGAKKTN